MRPAVVRLVESSGRFDRSPASLLRAARTYALRSNFQVHTEVARNERSNVLGRLSAWAVTHVENPAISGEDEVAILHKRLWWRGLDYETGELSSKPIARRNGVKCRSLDRLYENRRTKQRVMICAFHLPTRGDGQLAVWLDCIDRLMEKYDRWTRDPDIDCVILVGDINANWRSEAIRRQVRQAFPGADFTWDDGRAPTTNGTHGFNLIDWAIVHGGTITRAELLADDASSDHRPWFCRIRLPEVGAR